MLAQLTVVWKWLVYGSESLKNLTIFLIMFKGALSGLRQVLALEIPLKMIKNAFYFTLKAHFVLKIFNFSS